MPRWSRGLPRGLGVAMLAVLGAGETAGLGADQLDLAWYAPFWSGGGYGSEAIAFVSSLASLVRRLKVTQHGDTYSPAFEAGLSKRSRKMLEKLSKAAVSADRLISICHSEPGVRPSHTQIRTRTALHPEEFTSAPNLSRQMRVGRPGICLALNMKQHCAHLLRNRSTRLVGRCSRRIAYL